MVIIIKRFSYTIFLILGYTVYVPWQRRFRDPQRLKEPRRRLTYFIVIEEGDRSKWNVHYFDIAITGRIALAYRIVSRHIDVDVDVKTYRELIRAFLVDNREPGTAR